VPSLTRAEAERRRSLLDVQEYVLDFDLTDGESAACFVSTSTIRFTCNAPGSDTFVDVKADALLRAELNGQPVEVERWVDGRLHLSALEGTNVLVVSARMQYSRTGEGMHRYTDPQDGLVYVYSQAGAEDTPRLFACFEQPDLKAPFTVTVTAPADWTVLANAAGAADSPGRWRFEPTPPLSTYLVAVAAGPYAGVHDSHGPVALGLWCRASLTPHLDVERLFDTTKRGLDYFQGLFGTTYPFGKYDQIMVPELNWGAMENPGLVTFQDERYLPRGTTTEADREELAGVQLHEMAHMWFGDLVTMRWWDDLWLNESFAEYLAHRALVDATEHADAWTTFSVKRKAWGYHADQLSTTHPVATDADDTAEALGNFDGISYAKGASALRQLAAWVGDQAFVAGLRAHLDAHRFGNATLADFVQAVADASGRDVATWADRWLRTAGVSTLAVETAVADGRYTGARVVQTVPDRHPTPRPHTAGIGLFDLVGGTLSRRTTIEVDVDPAHSTAVPALLGQDAAALLLPNDGDLTFALTALDDTSLTTVLSHLDGLDDPLARALVWTSLWHMVGAGQLPPSTYVDVVRRGLSRHDGTPVTTMVLTRAVTAATMWSGAATEATSERFAAWCLAEVGESPPGSDVQLELARAWARATSDADLLETWASDDGLPAGLRLDTDLRWRLVQRLAALGAVGPSRLDAEYDRDRTTAAWLSRLTAGAALATAEAKESSWASAVGGGLSNHELQAVGRGFWQWGQATLLTPYRERYATVLPGLARTASNAVLDDFGRLLFPRTLIDQATVAAAEQLLATTDLPAPARRIVAECRDDVLEGLRATAAEQGSV
jgi:aminopeptidase N